MFKFFLLLFSFFKGRLGKDVLNLNLLTLTEDRRLARVEILLEAEVF